MKKISILVCLAFVFGCKDQPEQIPAYIHLQPFAVNAQGDATWHKFTEGWIYVNGEYLGAYTLPAQVPILAEGASEIWLYPGVKENGIAASPNIYPLMTRWEADLNLVPGESVNAQPSTKYDPAAKFPFGVGRGDFDGGSNIVLENRDDDPATSFVLTSDGAFAGKCILIEVDTAHPVIKIATEKASGLPITGSPEVWLEMQYKCEIPFVLSLLYSNNGGQDAERVVYLFNESEDWNKIYLNLTEAITSTQATDYRLYFQVGLPKDNSGNYSLEKGAVRIDNIRITHL